jgi:hypothetical protein
MGGVLLEAKTAFHSRVPELTPSFFYGVRIVHLFCLSVVILCVFTFWVSSCDVRYDFRIKSIFGSSLPLVQGGQRTSYIRVFLSETL